jgi:hypothetical protein
LREHHVSRVPKRRHSVSWAIGGQSISHHIIRFSVKNRLEKLRDLVRIMLIIARQDEQHVSSSQQGFTIAGLYCGSYAARETSCYMRRSVADTFLGSAVRAVIVHHNYVIDQVPRYGIDHLAYPSSFVEGGNYGSDFRLSTAQSMPLGTQVTLE